MHWSVEQRMVGGFALMGVLLAGSFGIAFQNTRSLIDASTRVARTQDVLTALAATEGDLRDAQAGALGWVITGEASFLAVYRTGRADLAAQIDHLHTVTADNPAQQARVTELTAQVDAALAGFQLMIDARQQTGFASAQQLVSAGQGEAALRAGEQTIVAMETAETSLLGQRLAAAQTDATQTVGAFAVLGLLGCILLSSIFLLIRRDRQARQRAARVLEQQRNLAQMLLQAQSDLGVGVVVANSTQIVYVNDAFGAITGYSPTELRTLRSPLQLIAAADRPTYLDHVRRLARGEDLSGLFETVMTQKGGQLIPVQGALQRIVFEGQPAQIAVMQDITERKQHERMKSEFISTVSHELRTPLTSIRGALGLMAGGVVGALSPQAQALVDMAASNSERLMRLINDILDIEKIESGQMVFDFQPQALMPLVEQALAANEGYAAQLGVHYVLAEAVPGGQVNVDAGRLIQVITNLLSNAAKFSPLGGTVALAVTRADAMLRVAVTDQGPGIPNEFRRRIFQKFAQADSSDTRQKGGTGLGLSIAKAIVERHGGEMGFSTVGPTTFYFTLPDQGATLLPAA